MFWLILATLTPVPDTQVQHTGYNADILIESAHFTI